MADATGETKEPLRVAFDRRLKLEFHGARITSDGGLLVYRELDDVLGLTATAASVLAEGRRGKNIRHRLLGLLRQAVYGRLAGYEDVNDAERLARDPAMCAIIGREGLARPAASTSEMGRFETGWLATEANLTALTDLSGAWIDRVHARRPPDGIILDMDSSESPTHGAQEGSAWNGHFGCTCYHPLFVFNQFGDLERCLLRGGTHGCPAGRARSSRAGWATASARWPSPSGRAARTRRRSAPAGSPRPGQPWLVIGEPEAVDLACRAHP
jgi:Transposase DDE domain group 1